ncbi:hypothetical protein KIN20_026858 [Parelaphostrongylus tenuis]|uniref:Uncharacterized protein n=1 Tax=Parelaphostrongylus tenuis TaxID=148309 RepID=A0AAD5WDJ0_PARTN|nr:hypothetical protein KIN20_026858 [Parelaphostrongylus tenuis]
MEEKILAVVEFDPSRPNPILFLRWYSKEMKYEARLQWLFLTLHSHRIHYRALHVYPHSLLRNYAMQFMIAT